MLIVKYADLRAKLKKAGDYEALDKLPKNASPVRFKNRCQITEGLKDISEIRYLQGYVQRYGFEW